MFHVAEYEEEERRAQVKSSSLDFVDMAGRWSGAAPGSNRSVHTQEEMGADKMTGSRPTEELGCLGGWETFCLASLNIVILLGQQSSAFDGTCQVPPGLGGRSSALVRQLSAPQIPESRRLLRVSLDTSKRESGAR